MRRNEVTIIGVVVALALAVGFWMLVLSPKRGEANSLNDEVGALRSQLADAQQAAAAGQQARRSFSSDYRQLVVLGKALPADGDQASLLVQLQGLADRSGVAFESLDLSQPDASASATATTPPPTTSSDSSSTSSTSTSTDGAAAALATEASAATLPLGAAVGPAGLPVMGYDLSFTGGFFQIAGFLSHVDAMVRTKRGAVVVDGRLVTVDSFTLTPADQSANASRAPKLTADLSVTTYLTPQSQGPTAGASPTSPAPTVPGATPTSTTTPTTGSTSTAAPTSTTSP